MVIIISVLLVVAIGVGCAVLLRREAKRPNQLGVPQYKRIEKDQQQAVEGQHGDFWFCPTCKVYRRPELIKCPQCGTLRLNGILFQPGQGVVGEDDRN